MSKNGIIAAGAAFGAWTQDPIDDPVSGFIGAGIGGALAYSMQEDLRKTYSNVSPEIMSFSDLKASEIRVGAITADSIEDSVDRIGRMLPSIFPDAETFGKMNLEQQSATGLRQQNIASSLSAVFGDMYNGAESLEKNVSQILAASSGDMSALSKLRTSLSGTDAMTSLGAITEAYTNHSASVKITTQNSRDEVIRALKDHFRGDLGFSDTDATSKATEQADFLHGRNATIEGSKVSMYLNTSAGKEKMSYDIITKRDGLQFTQSNGITTYHKGVNVFGEAFTDNKTLYQKGSDDTVPPKAMIVTADGKVPTGHKMAAPNVLSATQSYAADSILPLMTRMNGQLTDDEISTINKQVSTTRFSPEDSYKEAAHASGIAPSGIARNTSNTIDHSLTMTANKDGRYELKTHRTTITGNEPASPMTRMMTKIQRALGVNPMSFQGHNAIGTITDPTKIKDGFTMGIMANQSRNMDNVNIRDELPLRPSDSQFLNYLAEEVPEGRSGSAIEELRLHSNHAYRVNMSEKASDLVSSLYGSTNVMADGHGVFNPSHAEKLASTKTSAVIVPNIGDAVDPNYVLGENVSIDRIQMKDILETTNDAERLAKVQALGISVSPDDMVGMGVKGEKLGIHAQYTQGSLVDITNSKDGLRLVFDTKHVPTDIVKLQGVSTKAAFSAASSTDAFGKMALIASMENRGDLRFQEGQVIMDGVGMTTGEFRQRLDGLISTNTNVAKEYAELSKNVTLIQGWGEVGKDSIESLVQEANGFAKMQANLMASYKTEYAGANVDSFLDSIGTDRTKIQVKNRMLALDAFGNSKASQDALLTLGEAVSRNGTLSDKTFVGSLLAKEADLSEATLTKAYDLFNLHEDNIAGRDYVQYTPTTGEAGLGAGNVGRMSWLEKQSLLNLGVSQAALDEMSITDQKAMHELRSIASTENSGNIRMTAFGTDSAERLAISSSVFNNAPEDRAAFMVANGMRPDSKGLFQYGLNTPMAGINSIEIGQNSTGYTGFNEYGDKKTLTSIERARLNLIQSDIELAETRGADRAIVMSRHTENAQKLHSEMLSAVTGDSSLIKRAAKTEMRGAAYLLAVPAGGAIATHADRVLNSTPASSESSIRGSVNAFMQNENAQATKAAMPMSQSLTSILSSMDDNASVDDIMDKYNRVAGTSTGGISARNTSVALDVADTISSTSSQSEVDAAQAKIKELRVGVSSAINSQDSLVDQKIANAPQIPMGENSRMALAKEARMIGGTSLLSVQNLEEGADLLEMSISGSTDLTPKSAALRALNNNAKMFDRIAARSYLPGIDKVVDDIGKGLSGGDQLNTKGTLRSLMSGLGFNKNDSIYANIESLTVKKSDRPMMSEVMTKNAIAEIMSEMPNDARNRVWDRVQELSVQLGEEGDEHDVRTLNSAMKDVVRQTDPDLDVRSKAFAELGDRIKSNIPLDAKSSVKNSTLPSLYVGRDRAHEMIKKSYPDLSYEDRKKLMKSEGGGVSRVSMPAPKGSSQARSGLYDHLLVQVNREPNTSSGSSMTFNLFVSDEIEKTNMRHALFSADDKVFNTFSSLDFDFDHVRVAPMALQDPKMLNTFLKNAVGNVDEFRKFQDVLQSTSKKAGTVDSVLATGSSSGKSASEISYIQSEKARKRKTTSPEVTKISQIFRTSLNRNDIVMNGQALPRIKENAIVGGLVEALLKSNKGNRSGQRTSVEEFNSSLDAFRESGRSPEGTAKHRANILSLLDTELGANRAKLSTADSNDLFQMFENVADAHINTDKYVSENMDSLLANPKATGTLSNSAGQTIASALDHMQAKVFNSSGLIDIEKGERTIKSAASGIKRMYNELEQVGSLLGRNKSKLVAAGLALGVVAISSREPNGQLASTSPMAPGDRSGLQPLSQETTHTRKYNQPRKYSVSARTSNPDANVSSLDSMFNGNAGGIKSVRITDRNNNL